MTVLHRLRFTLARRLRSEIDGRGLTDTKAAEDMGLNKNALFRLLHPGDARYPNPDLRLLATAADWMGLHFGDLDPPNKRRIVTWADVSEAIHALEGLGPDDRELLQRIAFTSYSALHHRSSGPITPEAV